MNPRLCFESRPNLVLERYRFARAKRIFQHNYNPVRSDDGRIVGISCVVEDITERRNADDALRRAREELELRVQERTIELQNAYESLQRIEARLRKLSGHLINAQEQERHRIARELHDDFSQRLALIAVELELLGQASSETSQDPARRLKDLWGQAKELSTDIHRMSHQLHPSMLEQLGLVAALRSLCRDYSRQQNLQIKFDHKDMPEAIPNDVAICLYRIMQESLRNVVKHSQSAVARAEIGASSGEIRLCVSDAGVGFDLHKIAETRGLGLFSIEERLRLVGGKISIDAKPNRGTRIDVRVPLFPEAA